MTATVPHVRKRNGVYQFERRVPQSVLNNPSQYQALFGGQKLFRRSLRTKSPDEVHAAAAEAAAEFDSLVARATGKGARPAPAIVAKPTVPLREVTGADLDEIEARTRRLMTASWEKLYHRAATDPAAAENLEDRIRIQESVAAEHHEGITTIGLSDPDRPDLPIPHDAAVEFVELWKLDAPVGSHEFALIVQAVRKGMLDGRGDLDSLLAGKGKPTLPKRHAKETDVMTIKVVVERYLSEKSLAPKTVSGVKRALAIFVEVIGDKPVAALTSTDFRDFVRRLADGSVGGKTADSVIRPTSAKTVTKDLGFLRSAINHAIGMERFAGPNPAANIKVTLYAKPSDPAVMPAKRPFKTGELNKLFKYPWFTGCASPKQIHLPGTHRLTGAEFWVPIVALYTGCRAAELGGLRIAEVRLDDPHPHFMIQDNQYRGTKGSYARNVPILDALIAMGFSDYVKQVKAAGADRLFPDWISPKAGEGFDKDDAAWSNANPVRGFNRTLIPNVFGDDQIDGARSPVSFHSFRGSFKSMLSSPKFGLPVNFIHEVVGHEKQGMDPRYLGTISIEDTYTAMRACDYSGLATIAPPSIRL